MNQSSRDPSADVPEHLASECLIKLRNSASYPRAEISRLAELVDSNAADTAKLATTAIFASLVEPLADSFEPSAVTAYNRLFSQLLQHCRESDEGRTVDLELRGFNLFSEDDLFRRAELLRHCTPFDTPVASGDVKRIILLSRVTLGADVAITSVIVERMKRRFPDAEIVLIGGSKAAQLFGGDSRMSFKEVSYRRAGTLPERLSAWVELLEAARLLTEDLGPDQYLIVDPDSRLTQLGLLPVSRPTTTDTGQGLRENNYLFFPSREYGSSTSQSLAQLTSSWLNLVLGGDEVTLPRVALNPAHLNAAGALVSRVRASDRPIVSINFGVGENPAKRLGEEFETRLVTSLIDDGAMVILDRGAGEDEARSSDAVIRHVRSLNRVVAEIEEDRLQQVPSGDSPGADLLACKGGIGLLAALIGESDLYVGYDSAGQHIAAALGVPCIDVMAGFSSLRMIDRWRPTGPSETRMIIARDSTLDETIDSSREMLSRFKNHR